MSASPAPILAALLAFPSLSLAETPRSDDTARPTQGQPDQGELPSPVNPPPGDGATRATLLDAVEVTGLRQRLDRFPGAVDVIDAQTLQDGQRRVNLSEALERVPGVLALERNNYAQDLQVQSRGFGARSTFGIRGIQLVVDGIPGTALDGQGQAAGFPLDMLDRIEVLRGPLALQYGNAAGGAIVGHTDLSAADQPRLQAWAGGAGSQRLALRNGAAGIDGRWGWRAGASWFRTGGSREHSAAQRTHATAHLRWEPHDGHDVRLVADSLQQPWTEDPLGLTRAQWQADPQGTDPSARAFNTRKRIANHQLGLRWNWDYAAGREAWLSAHGIGRDIDQYLAIPPAAQQSPTSSGGVIDLQRSSTGLGLGHRWTGRRGTVAAGLDLGRLEEARRGHENFTRSPDGSTQLGVRGRLRRDEDNRILGHEGWITGQWTPRPDWSLLGGVRHVRQSFSSRDHYRAPGNGDDSGRLRHARTAVSAGLARAFGHGEVFASVGSGFETPTVTELAYRPDGSPGFNTDLQPARLRTAEVGARWRRGEASGSVAVYRIDSRGEIVPALSSGGRSSFANAGASSRQGVEAGISGELGPSWAYSVVANWIDARFDEPFSYRVNRGGSTDLRMVHAGARIPGIPDAHGFAELAWRGRNGHLQVALQARYRTAIPVDDLNSDHAPGHARLALVTRWRSPAQPGWHGFVRVDNLLDREHIGSVIVNEGNGRFFEPAPGRGITLGLGWTGRPPAAAAGD